MLNWRSPAWAQPAAGAHSAVPAARKLTPSSRHDRFRRAERLDQRFKVGTDLLELAEQRADGGQVGRYVVKALVNRGQPG
jgi:hypothetical protein